MTEPSVVVVDRNPRTRPRWRWSDAWAESRNHDLSTISTWRYARETIAHGGLRSLAIPLLADAALALVVIGVAFLAAVLATGRAAPQHAARC